MEEMLLILHKETFSFKTPETIKGHGVVLLKQEPKLWYI